MVATRRSTANGITTNGTSMSNLANTRNDTIHVLQSSNSKQQNAITTPKPSSVALKPVRLGSISEHDLILTSPSSCDTPENSIMRTPERNNDASDHAKSTAFAILHQLATEAVDPTGGALNPIIVTDSPPPVRAPTRKPRRKSKPHKFLDRGYRKLYSYPPSRLAPAPQPANGSTFTGHPSHDMYRMMNAKMVAALGSRSKGASGHREYNNHGLPFETQYSPSAQYLAQHPPAVNQQQPPQVQYYDQYPGQLNRYIPVHTASEETLRKKAVHYIREYSRPSPRKRRLADADPDETSGSESERQPTKIAHPSLLTSTPGQILTSPSSALTSGHIPNNPKPPRFDNDNHDPNINITQLTEHTALLTSLLQTYPHSTDQKGLREDIAMLASVQNQRVAEWMRSESQHARKRRRSDTDSAISVSSQHDGSSEVESRMTESGGKEKQGMEQEKEKQRDDEMRGFLSATADIWQDGSGLGVADVFAQGIDSSPVRSFDGEIEGLDEAMMGDDSEELRTEDGGRRLDAEP